MPGVFCWAGSGSMGPAGSSQPPGSVMPLARPWDLVCLPEGWTLSGGIIKLRLPTCPLKNRANRKTYFRNLAKLKIMKHCASACLAQLGLHAFAYFFMPAYFPIVIAFLCISFAYLHIFLNAYLCILAIFYSWI